MGISEAGRKRLDRQAIIHGRRRGWACRVVHLLAHAPLDWCCGGSIVTAAANVSSRASAYSTKIL